MSDQFIGEIRMTAFDLYVPNGWALCDGTELPQGQNQALFTVASGAFLNGSNIVLPDLRGRIPVGMGTRPGGSTAIGLGDKGGSETLATGSDIASGTDLGITFTPQACVVQMMVALQGCQPERP